MKVLIDTSAFIALLVKTEQLHTQFVQSYEAFKQKRALFFTSDYILDELFTRVIYDFGKKFAIQVVKILEKAIDQDELQLLHINPPLFSKAIPLFTKYAEHGVSFTDITSIVLLKEFKLDLIFTLDADFKKLRVNSTF